LSKSLLDRHTLMEQESSQAPLEGERPRRMRKGPAMYREYFHLQREPFNITPDPQFLYMTPQHQEALNHLLYGIRQRKGFICLTG
jgi:type II secretory pathway predicted ATPase ExeA